MSKSLAIVTLLILTGCNEPAAKLRASTREQAIERMVVEHEAMQEYIIQLSQKSGRSRQESIQQIDRANKGNWEMYRECQKNNCHDLLWVRARLKYLVIEVLYE